MNEQTCNSIPLMCYMEHYRRTLLLQLHCMAYNQSIFDYLQVVENTYNQSIYDYLQVAENKVLRKILQTGET